MQIKSLTLKSMSIAALLIGSPFGLNIFDIMT